MMTTKTMTTVAHLGGEGQKLVLSSACASMLLGSKLREGRLVQQ
jgi:hypothetical protein